MKKYSVKLSGHDVVSLLVGRVVIAFVCVIAFFIVFGFAETVFTAIIDGFVWFMHNFYALALIGSFALLFKLAYNVWMSEE